MQPPFSLSRLFPMALIAVLSLSACQSSEEKAEAHYQSALQLLADKDEERAIVEFRNVFQLNGFHKEARQAYADLLVKRGQTTEAYGQYLRLIEQYPETLPVRQTLAELAIGRNDWDEAQRHGEAAITLAAEDPRSQSIAIVLDYRKASIDRDAEAITATIARARSLLEHHPEDALLRRIVLDSLVTSGDTAAALTEVDRLLEQDKDAFDLNRVRLQLLNALDDQPAVGKQLRRLLELQPDNQELQRAILQWHMSRKDPAGAEALLRELAGPLTGPVEGHVAVVQFLKVTQDNNAALAELERLIDANGPGPESLTYRALRAAMVFETGKSAEALQQFADLLAAEQEDTDQLRDIRITYARVLDAIGDRSAASAEVETVLAADPSHVEALKLRAKWKIAADQPGDAIIDLRTALNQDPRDPGILTLMAEAHLREGSPELAGERMALAVEASGARAEESLLYSRFLIEQNRPEVAARVLTDARRQAPGNLRVLTALVEVQLAMQNWTAAEEAIAAIAQIDSAEAKTTTERMRTALALAQNRIGDALEMMQGMAESGTANIAIIIATIQTQVRSGNLEEARAFLNTELAKAPDDPQLQALSANIDYMTGNVPAAETALRTIVANDPAAEAPIRMLFTLLERAGRQDEAAQVLEAGLQASPESGMLLWIKAGLQERAGDIDGAIAVYEKIYATDSGNQIIANNLASLLSTHRTDAQSLERAYAIARRLRGSQVPAFQDTYGWIEYRRGNFNDALLHLEPAALGLPADPLAQFHLGMTYAALGRLDLAKTTLEKSLTIAADSPLAQFTIARETLEAIKTAAPDAKIIPAGLTQSTADGQNGGN